jgi:hypothetical protein
MVTDIYTLSARNGNVSQGVLNLLKELPLTIVKAEDLPGLMSSELYSTCINFIF